MLGALVSTRNTKRGAQSQITGLNFGFQGNAHRNQTSAYGSVPSTNFATCAPLLLWAGFFGTATNCGSGDIVRSRTGSLSIMGGNWHLRTVGAPSVYQPPELLDTIPDQSGCGAPRSDLLGSIGLPCRMENHFSRSSRAGRYPTPIAPGGI
jgi:hypothetical protein